MNPKTFEIEGKGLISILVSGSINKSHFLDKLIKNNQQKKLVLFQPNDYYFDCVRVTMGLNTDFKKLIESFEQYDIFVIDYFAEWANSTEIIEFIEYIKNQEKYKDKTFVILFTPKDIKSRNEMTLSRFTKFKDIIEKYSSEIYIVNRIEFLEYKLQDKDGNILSTWKENWFDNYRNTRINYQLDKIWANKTHHLVI